MTYDEAVAFCAKEGMIICPYEAYSPNGTNDTPFAMALNESTSTKLLFYAQMYNLNQHWPYIRDTDSSDENLYYLSFRSIDECLKGVFTLLVKRGRLGNTVIIGSGGELCYGFVP